MVRACKSSKLHWSSGLDIFWSPLLVGTTYRVQISTDHNMRQNKRCLLGWAVPSPLRMVTGLTQIKNQPVRRKLQSPASALTFSFFFFTFFFFLFFTFKKTCLTRDKLSNPHWQKCTWAGAMHKRLFVCTFLRTGLTVVSACTCLELKAVARCSSTCQRKKKKKSYSLLLMFQITQTNEYRF